jgi:hypothetical protein
VAALKGVDLFGQAGDFPGRGAPMEGALAGYPGDQGRRLVQGRLCSFQVFLGYGLADLPNYIFNPGFSGLVAHPAFFILPGPLHGGKVSCQFESSVVE